MYKARQKRRMMNRSTLTIQQTQRSQGLRMTRHKVGSLTQRTRRRRILATILRETGRKRRGMRRRRTMRPKMGAR